MRQGHTHIRHIVNELGFIVQESLRASKVQLEGDLAGASEQLQSLRASKVELEGALAGASEQLQSLRACQLEASGETMKTAMMAAQYGELSKAADELGQMRRSKQCTEGKLEMAESRLAKLGALLEEMHQKSADMEELCSGTLARRAMQFSRDEDEWENDTDDDEDQLMRICNT
jgi:chromosome segregation ATPase